MPPELFSDRETDGIYADNRGDVRHAKELCGAFAMNHKVIKGLPHSCWIGLSDHAQEGGFAWLDGTVSTQAILLGSIKRWNVLDIF